MGAVYRAFDEKLQRPVALKRLLPDTVDPKRALRFRREARIAARLNHPAIVHIYEVVEAADGDWIVMELVVGKTLDQILREGLPALPQTVRLVREIAEGLAEAHKAGVVHRDLKAANVMVTAAGRAKILDFGLAKILSGEAGQDLSDSGMVLGTCHAMSPEQAQGRPLDGRSDLFSLGSLLYELVTGASPFLGTTATETLTRICLHEPRSVGQIDPSLPHELVDLTYRLLRKSPDERLQRSEDVIAVLEGLERSAALDRTRHHPLASPTLATVPTELEVKAAPPPRLSSPPRSASERRQITVVCCEIAAATDSTPDPETMFELIWQLRPVAERVAQRYEGTVGSVVGNRLLLYFGHPVTHEDDARRAVRAALDLLSEAGASPADGAEAWSLVPTLRISVHTGPAVVSTNPHAAEPVMLGSTLDIAIRLQASAAPGTVVMSAATRALVQRSYSTDELPALPSGPGLTDRLVPYRVRPGSDSGEEPVLDVSPLVGRDRELDLLLNRWEQANAGAGHAVLVSGEPGIGKSRLLRAMRERVQDQASARVRWLTLQPSTYTQNTPLQPVVAFLHGLVSSHEGGAEIDRLAALLDNLSLAEALPLFASLLDLPAGDRPALPPMPPERQREETLDALVALVLELSHRQPLVLLVEDLHWLDATTLAWLGRLVEQAATAPLLLLMTMRPNMVELSWATHAGVTQVTLSPLGAEDTARLVGLLAADRPLDARLQRQILARTDGVPLYVEELTRAALDSGASEPRELPATLRDSLTARLGRLGPAKEIAQLASVIGRTFSLRLLAAIAAHDTSTLEHELRHLVQSGLVHRRGFGAQARYAFKHALVRDAAYESLLRRERQLIHLRIALAMEEARAAGLDSAESEEIAYHYMAGEQYARAFERWVEAGQRALGRFAHVEAIGHFERALQALDAHPESPSRDRQEITVRSLLAMSLQVIRGQSAPEVEAVFDRIFALRGHIGDVPAPIYFALWNFYAQRGRLLEARELAEERLQTAVATGDELSRVLGLYTSAAIDQYLGRFAQARAGFEQVVAVSPEDGVGSPALAYDVGVVSMALLGDMLWHLGRPDQARAMADRAIARSQRFSPFTQSVALVIRIILSTSMRDAATTKSRAGELIALSEQHSFQYWTVHWRITLALARIDGDPAPVEVDAAIEEAASAITMMRTAYSSNLQGSRFLSWVIQACVDHGRFGFGRRLLEEALQIVESDEERYTESDLRRLEARIAQAEGTGSADVERRLERALELARAHGARMFELRAAVDLASLQAELGRGAEARALLDPIYRSFSEGADTVELRAAQALLARL
jgi:class 3 adenylate cyclase/tetratricopeptide (TPR) repeat protein